MNKLSKLILMLPLALAPLAGQAAPKGGSHAALAAGFVAPPDSVQTSVYWYWLSGNVSKEGVVKDLEAMKRAGINRAFIGNIGLGELARWSCRARRPISRTCGWSPIPLPPWGVRR